MSKKHKIDKHLNEYTTDKFYPDTDTKFTWWWNADKTVAEALVSAARHVRKDGCHMFTDVERAELKRFEKLWSRYDCIDWSDNSDEAFELFGKWFTRLWD